MNNYEYCANFIATKCHPRSRALDYGCGRGEIVDRLLSLGADAYGCDVFYGGGSYKNAVRPGLLEERRIRQMADNRVPFDDEFFDVVVHNQVFEHVPDLSLAVFEIARVLKPGGTMLALFPDESCWREGHCGIPFLHWFAKGSGLRVYYALAMRSLGMGYHHDGLGRLEWSRNFCDWLDKWTYYRPYQEIAATLARYFSEPEHLEREWFDARMGRLSFMPGTFKTFIVRRWGGLIFRCEKR